MDFSLRRKKGMGPSPVQTTAALEKSITSAVEKKMEKTAASKKSPSPRPSSSTNGSSGSLKRPSTSPIAAMPANGCISAGDALSQSSLASSASGPTSSAFNSSDLNNVANLALMQQLQNSSMLPGFSGLESLFRTNSVPSFNPYTAAFGYPGLPSPNLFGSSSALLNGEPPSKKSMMDPLSRDALNGIGSSNGKSPSKSSVTESPAASISPPRPEKSSSKSSATNGVSYNGATNSSSSCSVNGNTTSDTDSIRNLIKSYRESAAFLSRSADELEKLLTSAGNS